MVRTTHDPMDLCVHRHDHTQRMKTNSSTQSPAMLGDSSGADPGPSQCSAAARPQDVLWVRCHENGTAGADQTGLSPQWPPATSASGDQQVCVSIDHRLDVAIFRHNGHSSKYMYVRMCTSTHMHAQTGYRVNRVS